MIRYVLLVTSLVVLIGACQSVPLTATESLAPTATAVIPVVESTPIPARATGVVATATAVATATPPRLAAIQTPEAVPTASEARSSSPAATGELSIPPIAGASRAEQTPVTSGDRSLSERGNPVPPTPTSVPRSNARGIVRDPTGTRPGVLRTIAIDPGHGGPEIGSVAGDLLEKDLNLRISLYLAELLQEEGFRVVLTRDEDRAVDPAYTQSGVFGQVALDLQARVDIANNANADLFLSIHNNGSGDPNQRGMEVWFNRGRPFSDRNIALAELVLEKTLTQMRSAGYNAFNRGIKDDANFRIFRDRVFNIYVLGPGTGARPHEPTRMPGVLSEALILSNPGDAAALRRPEIRRAIALGHRDAVLAYFEQFSD
jgi:N-acetylmuramoyl-L-alanine amidase